MTRTDYKAHGSPFAFRDEVLGMLYVARSPLAESMDIARKSSLGTGLSSDVR